jgi:hypothetical protein
VSFSISDAPLQFWSNPNEVVGLVWDGECAWAATLGGVVRWWPDGHSQLYINLHFYDARRVEGEPPLAETLASEPLRFLGPYIHENLPRWARGKRHDFVDKLTTPAARELAQARLDRLERLFAELGAELDALQPGVDHTRIDLMLHYMRRTDDPSMWDETERLARDWRAPGTPVDTLALIEALRAEMLGLC